MSFFCGDGGFAFYKNLDVWLDVCKPMLRSDQVAAVGGKSQKETIASERFSDGFCK